MMQQAHAAQAAHKPFWVQLVGSGLTTACAAHFGAVLPGATWPADSDMHLYESQLIKPEIEVRDGYYRVPEGPGLGVEIDHDALARYGVDYTFLEPPRHIYRYLRAGGEADSSLDPIPDDGNANFARLYASVQHGHVFRRREEPART